MQFPKTIVIRHRKENLKKCSLSHLDRRTDTHFITYPFEELPNLEHHLMLVMEGAPLLSQEDKDFGILLLDSTWRYLPKMVQAVDRQVVVKKRCLPPHFATAYPREQKDCIDPNRGLSSLEALYIAYHLMGRNTEGLLDNYHWKEHFLSINSLYF